MEQPTINNNNNEQDKNFNQQYKLKQLPEDFKVIEDPFNEFSDSGEYLIFSMQKKNYTTENAIQQICKSTQIPRKSFGYAGNKDSKAITYQNISVKLKSKEPIENLKLRDIELTFKGYAANPISLGNLHSNTFEITVRNIEESPTHKSEMINYFGEQRFSKHNSEIGKAIIQKNFKLATELICSSSDTDKIIIEEFLHKSNKEYVGAIKKLPWKVLTLYIHALQSDIWNRCAQEFSKKNPEVKEIELPLIGFETNFENESVREICERLLEEENIKINDFIIRAIPDLTSSGNKRKLYCKIQNLEIGKIEVDELNSGKKKCTVKFKLDKGCYATEAIKTLFEK